MLVALFVSGPAPGATSTTKKFVSTPAGNTATVLVTCAPPGSVSTTTTFVADDGPALVTVTVFV